MTGHFKIAFALTPDEDGYPPFAWETAWASASGTDAVLENIPFFAYGVSLGDTVAFRLEEGQRVFERVVTASGHTTLRILLTDVEALERVRSELHRLGCKTEVGHTKHLVAVDVPPEASFVAVRTFLEGARDEEILEYEDGCLRHDAA